MLHVNKAGLLLTLFIILNSFYSFATWSIIIADPLTKEIGIAGASCTYNVYGIGGIVPGRGAIVAQAMSNMKAKEKGLELLRQGKSPEQILYFIIDPSFDRFASSQQYGIVSLTYIKQPVTYTGANTHASNGSYTADGITVQGNTLADDKVLKVVYDTVLNGRKRGLSIAATLMKALEAGAREGGDKRCGNQKASSAFITVMKATDRPQNPFLNLVVSGIGNGGGNAVELLVDKYKNWMDKQR